MSQHHVTAASSARPDAHRGSTHRWAGLLLGAALVTTGLMAGLFFAFSVSVMPGLGAGDDRTFVTAMQHMNAAIENGVFAVAFGGALVFTAAAVVMLRGLGHRSAGRWALVAAVLYVVVLVLTFAVNIPLNDELARAGAADRIPDLAAVRHDFESVWVPVNAVRTALCAAALACLAPALIRHGARR